MPLLIFGFTALGIILAGMAKGYMLLVLSLIAMTATVGVGLNVLLGLTGQVSFGHVGFYALGAYTTGILALKGVSFWIAFPLAGLIGGAIGFLLALPALRVKGPYLAMVTIAFAFIIEHGAVEWRDLTGGANGLMGIMPPALGRISFGEREMAMLAVLLAGLAFALYHRLDKSAWGLGMRAVRDAETAAQSLGLDPVKIKVVAFTLSAVLTALAGALFSPLMMFIAPSSFPFFQSILFLLAVIIGGAGSVLGPLLGAVVVVGLPEVLSDFAEYRLLFFGVVLLVVLWAAPKGLIGTLGNRFRREDPRRAMEDSDMLLPDIAAWLKPADPAPLEVKGLGISFGGLRAAHDVAFTAQPGQVTSVIGPNGAGKTTVLNMIGGFYKPGSGSIQLQHGELAGLPAWRIARAGIARTYQTTQLFPELSVIDNIRIALRRGRLGALLGRAGARGAEEDAVAEALLAFVGYREPLARLAGSLPHVDRRLVEIARALATRPRVLLLDEPAAGLMRADKDDLSLLLRRIADAGIAVILVEHDMTLVMGISDHIVVLDAGTPIAAGAPLAVRGDARVIKAYLGEAGATGRPRAAPWQGPSDPILAAVNLTAGYGAAPVLEKLNIAVKRRTGGSARRQWCRQIHRYARHQRPAAAYRGPGAAERCRVAPAIGAGHCARRPCPGAGRAAGISRTERARQPQAWRLYAPRLRCCRDRSGAEPFPTPARTPATARRPAFGRRTTDAGPGPRHAGEAESHAAGRTLARPGASHRAGSLYRAGRSAR